VSTAGETAPVRQTRSMAATHRPGKVSEDQSQSSLPLFEEALPPLRRRLARNLRSLATEGVWIGTSSWKYEGWLGQIYTPEHYHTRGRFSKKKFQITCLAEYAETFPIVCGDFSFYQFPSDTYWRKLFASAPPTLQYAFKVPEEITVRKFPLHARYGARRGQENPNFLNAALLTDAFLRPLEPFHRQVAALIFEFGAFSKQSYGGPGEFATDVGSFLARLPGGYRYSVEIRNPEFLGPEYFDCLRRHGVAHVFNAWARMPELSTQMEVPDAFTAPFTVARALLKHGRGYENAVELFRPYDRIQEPNPRGRTALRGLIRRARASSEPSFIFVNNRFEGNAPSTIAAVLEEDEA